MDQAAEPADTDTQQARGCLAALMRWPELSEQLHLVFGVAPLPPLEVRLQDAALNIATKGTRADIQPPCCAECDASTTNPSANAELGRL